MESTGFVSAAMGGEAEGKHTQDLGITQELYLQWGLILWEKGTEPWERQANGTFGAVWLPSGSIVGRACA